jgi:hypothetical protein
MDIQIRDTFMRLFPQYFPGAELPITFAIGGDETGAAAAPEPKGWKCLVCDLLKVRKGNPLVMSENALSCGGAKFFCGYAKERAPDFRYFLSTGKPGGIPGERYKRTPELVDAADINFPRIPVEGRNYVFKRWDTLTAADNPDVVIFFARPEVLSGLFTLANFDRADPGGVVCPFTSGCGSIILYPWLEQQKDDPKAVLGMFDPSARPCVPVDVLSFAVPMKKFSRMIGYLEESFLITDTWKKVEKKIERSNKVHGA